MIQHNEMEYDDSQENVGFIDFIHWYNFDYIEPDKHVESRVVIISEEDTPKYWTDINKTVGPTEEDEQHSPIHIEYDKFYGKFVNTFKGV